MPTVVTKSATRAWFGTPTGYRSSMVARTNTVVTEIGNQDWGLLHHPLTKSKEKGNRVTRLTGGAFSHS
jgi:hypothetical protein